VEKELVELCKKMGHQIGFQAAERQQASILYDLRRVKRFDAFLHVLERLKHRIPSLSTEQEFFERINQKNWREYKSLISIFAKDQESKVTYARAKEKEVSAK
jgi:hypothetical protein